MKKVTIFSTMFFCLICVSAVLAWTNCPPASLSTNPAPIVSGGTPSCIVEADWVELNLNKNWSRNVTMEAGKSYWFTASKCARAKSIKGEIIDSSGKVLKSDSGSEVAMCFRAPTTGKYTVRYRVTALYGYSFAITNACLSRSNCKP